MKLIMEIKIENLYKSKDYINPKTGETKVAKWKVQSFEEIETEHGNQMKLFDVSITDDQYNKLKDQVGKVVQIPVGVYVNDKTNKHGFYGI